ncbi:MAG: Gfo/Idh/MocA family oxidoreductase, partial [Pikeienuella sp.]
MFLHSKLMQRADRDDPVRVCLIGAGKFGSMFLSQVPSTPGLTVTHIADLNPDGARAACANVGWDDALVQTTHFTDDAFAAMAAEDVDVVVEATGNPHAGVRHARVAIAAGKHVVMVNVEADVLAGA